MTEDTLTIITHLRYPLNDRFATKAVIDCMAAGQTEGGFIFQNGIEAFVKRNKKSWTVWLQNEPQP